MLVKGCTLLILIRRRKCTHRPCERERKPDRVVDSFPWRITFGCCWSQYGSDYVPKGARGGRVDLHLVLLQAHSKPWMTRSSAFGAVSRFPIAAFSQVILSRFVVERFQPQLKHSRRVGLRQEYGCVVFTASSRACVCMCGRRE